MPSSENQRVEGIKEGRTIYVQLYVHFNYILQRPCCHWYYVAFFWLIKEDYSLSLFLGVLLSSDDLEKSPINFQTWDTKSETIKKQNSRKWNDSII